MGRKLDKVIFPNTDYIEINPSTKSLCGNIVSFPDGASAPMPKLEVGIEPQQDLHGYDNPWVGGAGKNKFDVNYYGSITTYFNRVDTTFINKEVDSRNDFRLLIQAFNGGAFISESNQEVITSAGRYSVIINIPSTPTFIRIKHNGSSSDLTLDYPFTQTGQYTISLTVVKTNPSTVGGLEFKDIQLESGSTATSYAPYSNICPISGWSGANVGVIGKNLFDKNSAKINKRVNANGVIESSTDYFCSEYISIKKNTPYYFKEIVSSGYFYSMALFDINKTFVELVNFYSANKITSRTATFDIDGYVIINSYTSNIDTTQVTFGSTATAYEPYNGHTYTIDLNGTRYGGKVDLVSGVLTVDRVEVIYDGSSDENWIYTSSLNRVYVYIPNAKKGTSGSVLPIQSNLLHYSQGVREDYGAHINDQGNLIVFAPNDIADANTWKTWLASNNVQVVYELATPQTIQLTPTVVKSLRGMNNVWADSGDVCVTYVTQEYDNMTAKVSEFSQFAKTANKQVPAIHKKYESTSYYATTASQENSTWYFMSVKPDSWYKPWKVKFKVHTYCPNYPSYESITWSTFTGREQSLSYANFNERYDSAHYYISAAPLKKAGFDAGYGHALGVSILYGGGYTTPAYYRTFEIDYYECENCTVTILDSPTKLASWNGYSTTNYNGVSNYDAINRGLRETSDDNDTTTLQSAYSQFTAGGSGIKQYSLVGRLPDGTYSSFTTTNGTGTDKVKTTSTFMIGKLYYMNTSGNFNAGSLIGTSVVRAATALVDMRYSLNIANNASFPGLAASKPVYIVFNLADAGGGTHTLADKWWSQDLPTTADNKIYVLMGYAYDWYRADLFVDNPAFYHNGTAVVEYIGDAQTVSGHTVAKNVPSDAVFTDTKNTAGSTDTSSKIFLIGTTSQTSSSQTYSQDTAYVGTNGCLYSGGTKVLTAHQDISGKADKATTLAGYGITDAKIASGTITLGSNTITPLTASSTLDATKLSGTIPSSCYTDTKVTQTNITTAATYSIPLCKTYNTTTETDSLYKNLGLSYSLNGNQAGLCISEPGKDYASTLSAAAISNQAIQMMSRASTTATPDILAISSTDISFLTTGTWDGTNVSLKTAVTAAKGTVTQTPTDSTNSTYELLFSGTADNTEHTEGAKKSQYATFNPFAKAFTFGTRKSDSTVGRYSFAEGYNVVASSQHSHAEGEYTVASGICSHAEGYSTTANHESQHVFGEYNVLDASTAGSNSRGNYVEIVGNGTGDRVRSNARTLDWSGNEWLAGGLTLAGASGDITLSGSGNTWDGTNTSLKTAIKDKVSKSSGTTVDNPILGAIAITDNFFSKVASVDLSKSNNNLSSDYFGLVDFRDKNKKRFGYIQYGVRTSGGTDASLRSVNFPAGGTTEYTNSLTLVTSKAGAYTYSVTNPANFRSAIGAAASSSINTKENIKDLTEDEALKLLEIRPVSFDYKQGFDIDNKYERNYGVIAEETLDIIPSVVNVPTTEGWEFDAEAGTNQELITVDYAKFVPYLIKLVQMQQKEIDELKKR